jgi:hypothetical protein
VEAGEIEIAILGGLMKRIIAALLISISTTSLFAYEVPANPDRYMSLALDYTYLNPSEDVNFRNDTNGATSGFTVFHSEKDFSANLILPINKNLSFNIHGTNVDATASSDVALLGTKSSVKTTSYGAGVKFYFH